MATRERVRFAKKRVERLKERINYISSLPRSERDMKQLRSDQQALRRWRKILAT